MIHQAKRYNPAVLLVGMVWSVVAGTLTGIKSAPPPAS